MQAGSVYRVACLDERFRCNSFARPAHYNQPLAPQKLSLQCTYHSTVQVTPLALVEAMRRCSGCTDFEVTAWRPRSLSNGFCTHVDICDAAAPTHFISFASWLAGPLPPPEKTARICVLRQSFLNYPQTATVARSMNSTTYFIHYFYNILLRWQGMHRHLRAAANLSMAGLGPSSRLQ